MPLGKARKKYLHVRLGSDKLWATTYRRENPLYGKIIILKRPRLRFLLMKLKTKTINRDVISFVCHKQLVGNLF